MKIGIVGLPGAGKTTIFNALTGSAADTSAYSGGSGEPNLAVVKVPDSRLERLSAMYKPKKTTHAQVEYVDVAGTIPVKEHEQKGSLDKFLTLLRPVDAILHVVRGFELHGTPPDPQRDVDDFEAELVLADLIIAEKRLERLRKEVQKGKKGDPRELELLDEAVKLLNEGKPLRPHTELANAPELKGYAFLSAKPCIVVLNIGDEIPYGKIQVRAPEGVPMLEIKGRLEMELSELSEDEAQEFRGDLGLSEPATFQLIRTSHKLLGLISFFTVGEDEVRAWNIRQGTTAQRAAGVIHTDIERGFIRAEVVAYDDLEAAGSYSSAQKAGKVRLEGKEYIVQDGDIINFRFNV